MNGGDAEPDAIRFDLVATEAQRLNGSLARSLQGFKDSTVHAVAAIGNPQRFFDLLRANGIQVIEHSFPDHAAIAISDLRFGDQFNIFLTEKDVVKLDRNISDKYWFVPVDLIMDAENSAAMMTQIVSRLREYSGSR